MIYGCGEGIPPPVFRAGPDVLSQDLKPPGCFFAGVSAEVDSRRVLDLCVRVDAAYVGIHAERTARTRPYTREVCGYSCSKREIDTYIFRNTQGRSSLSTVCGSMVLLMYVYLAGGFCIYLPFFLWPRRNPTGR